VLLKWEVKNIAMDAKDFFDSGIYVAIVAAAFVMVMLMIVLISKLMGGPKKPDRKKKAAALITNETLLEEGSALAIDDNSTVQPSVVAPLAPVSGNDTDGGGNVSPDPSASDTSGSNSGGEAMSPPDNVPKPEVEITPELNPQKQPSLEVPEIEPEDVEIDKEDDDNFFNIEYADEDNVTARVAADLTDVDLDSLGALTKEVSQLITGGKSKK